MKIVGVFGANGFIGRHLVRQLTKSGIKTIAFGREFPDDFYLSVGREIETRKVNLDDELTTQSLLQSVTDVVQLVNSSNPSMGNRRVISDLMQNVAPQVRFIESCIMADIKSFVFISSGGTVYGRPQISPIPESHPTEPLSSYGLSKLIVEHYLRMLSTASNMGYTILRVSNPFGPGQLSYKGQGLVATILKRYRDNEPLTVFGTGAAERDYIYIDDVVDAIISAINSPPLHDILNIGSGCGRSINEVIKQIEREVGTGIARRFVDDRSTDVPSNVLDICKARRLLNWTPKVSFVEGVRLTVADHLAANHL